MAEKIQSTIVNTIPLWKSQMVLALGIEHSNQAARGAAGSVTDMTNELLRKNADVLKTATIETAKESERGIVDIETLKHTNETLISTFDEVMRIQSEGREKRQAAEVEMRRIEGGTAGEAAADQYKITIQARRLCHFWRMPRLFLLVSFLPAGRFSSPSFSNRVLY